jgi:hypothetical protein
MSDASTASDKTRWSRREAFQATGSKGRKSAPLATSTIANHISKLVTLLRWQFLRNNIDYHEV